MHKLDCFTNKHIHEVTHQNISTASIRRFVEDLNKSHNIWLYVFFYVCKNNTFLYPFAKKNKIYLVYQLSDCS